MKYIKYEGEYIPKVGDRVVISWDLDYKCGLVDRESFQGITAIVTEIVCDILQVADVQPEDGSEPIQIYFDCLEPIEKEPPSTIEI